jgi:MFS family permease
MGILTMVEDRPTPASVYNWRVYVSAMTASFASCMIGYTTSFIGTTVSLESFQDEFGLSSLGKSQRSLIQANVVSLFQAGAFFGSIFSYGTAYYFGRRITLWTFVSMFIVGVCITFASIGGHLGPMYAGRFISGFGVGGCTMIVGSDYQCGINCALTVPRFPSSSQRSRRLLFAAVWSALTNSAGRLAALSVSGSTLA